MAPGYNLAEPFPNAPNRVHTGRGGAGNVTRTRPKVPGSSSTNSISSSAYPPPRGPSSMSTSSGSSPPRAFTSGRGGVGNLHPGSERAMFSFDEELERLQAANDTIAPVYHIGRGGQGNLVVGGGRGSISDSDSARSESSSGIGATGGFKSKLEKVKSNFSRK